MDGPAQRTRACLQVSTGSIFVSSKSCKVTVWRGRLCSNSDLTAPQIPCTASAGGQSATQIEQARKTSLIGDFKEGITVEPLKRHPHPLAEFRNGSPEMAASVVNHLIDNYIESNIQERFEFTSRASGGMERQLQDLKRKVEKSQQALVDYERQNLIVNVGDKQTINDKGWSNSTRNIPAPKMTIFRRNPFMNLPRPMAGRLDLSCRTAFFSIWRRNTTISRRRTLMPWVNMDRTSPKLFVCVTS